MSGTGNISTLTMETEPYARSQMLRGRADSDYALYLAYHEREIARRTDSISELDKDYAFRLFSLLKANSLWTNLKYWVGANLGIVIKNGRCWDASSLTLAGVSNEAFGAGTYPLYGNGVTSNSRAAWSRAFPSTNFAGGYAKCISFNGYNEAYRSYQNFTDADNFTYLVVARPASFQTFVGATGGFNLGAANVVLQAGNVSSPLCAGVVVDKAGVEVIGHGSGYYSRLASARRAISDWVVVIVVFTSRIPTIYINGINAGTVTSVAASGLIYPTFHFGGGIDTPGSGNYGYFSGEVLDIAMFNTSLSAPQRAILENFLNLQYGIYGQTPQPRGGKLTQTLQHFEKVWLSQKQFAFTRPNNKFVQ